MALVCGVSCVHAGAALPSLQGHQQYFSAVSSAPLFCRLGGLGACRRQKDNLSATPTSLTYPADGPTFSRSQMFTQTMANACTFQVLVNLFLVALLSCGSALCSLLFASICDCTQIVGQHVFIVFWHPLENCFLAKGWQPDRHLSLWVGRRLHHGLTT